MTFKMTRHPFYLLFATIVLCSCSTSQDSHRPSFKAWLGNFKQEAIASGISPDVVNSAFAGITKPSKEVLAHDHTQPESTKTFTQYSSVLLKQSAVDAAEDQWESHTEILKNVEQAYDVPTPIMLALWQTESRFGEHQGNFSIIESLATLAYDGRRSAFFRKELLNALKIIQEEHIDPAMLTGSWAGAMGQVQFMPSTYLSLAVDFDGDGKKDIWNSDADAVASMGNYLHTRGWDNTIGWGMHVKLPQGADVASWIDYKQQYTFLQWQKLGLRRLSPVRRSPGTRIKGDTLLRLVMPDADWDNAYLVTANYDVLMDWNRSIYFATGIGLLADAIEKSHQE